MKNPKIRLALILFIASVVACVAVLLMFVFIPEHPEDMLGLGIFMSVWSFTLIPAYAISIKKFNGIDFSTAFWLGYVYGFGLIVLPLIFAPFFAVWFYIDAFFIPSEN